MQVKQYNTDIVLLDVVGFSSLSNEKQLATVMVITAKLKDTIELLIGQAFLEQHEIIVGFVPTGDGFYVILQPEFVGYGLFLAISLRSSLLLASHRAGSLFAGVKTAVDMGAALPFTDINAKENFVGDGLNTCVSLLRVTPSNSPTEGIPEDNNFIIVSEDAWEWFAKTWLDTPEMKDWLDAINFAHSECFNIKDKNGKQHKVRFVESSRHVAINPPRPPDVDERISKLTERLEKEKPNLGMDTACGQPLK